MAGCSGVTRRRTSRIFLSISILSLLLLLAPWRPQELKKAPTDFSSLSAPESGTSGFLQPDSIFRFWTGSSRTDIDYRYLFVRELGSGAEGDVKVYNDTFVNRTVAIKTFRSFERNSLPVQVASSIQGAGISSWPAEIPATILLGGRKMHCYSQDLFDNPSQSGARLDTLPALDYFLTPAREPHTTKLWEWQLVMPYLGSDSGGGQGTLTDLAKQLKKGGHSIAELDSALRPGFHRLLGSLTRLHAEGFCHNDIKPDNVYAQDKKNWLLGDLGNVREVIHPYFWTEQWALEGQWSDCTQNDVRRTIISYITLIRRASVDAGRFDNEFFCGNSSLSRIYWNFMRHPISAAQLQDTLEQGLPEHRVTGTSYCINDPPALTIVGLMGLHKLSITHFVNSALRWSEHPSRIRFWLSRLVL